MPSIKGNISTDQSKYVTCDTSRVATSSHASMLQMACWNCRGLWSNKPYIESLFFSGVKVLVLAEHWLWPYELNELDVISDVFEALVRLMQGYLRTLMVVGGMEVLACCGIGLLEHHR